MLEAFLLPLEHGPEVLFHFHHVLAVVVLAALAAGAIEFVVVIWLLVLAVGVPVLAVALPIVISVLLALAPIGKPLSIRVTIMIILLVSVVLIVTVALVNPVVRLSLAPPYCLYIWGFSSIASMYFSTAAR